MKAAVIGIVGRTNAGKSTLVNALVGEKVSITSPVEQTTRNTIRGIVADPRGQLVLMDTPGLHKAVGPLGRLLNGMARASASGTDVLCVTFDAAQAPQIEDEGWMARVAKEKTAGDKVLFVLNKADSKPFFERMFRDAWAAATAAHPTTATPVWVCASALTEAGAAPVKDALFELSPEGEALFPEDVVTDYPRKLAMADVVREKLLSRLFQEIPHELGVAVKDVAEGRDGWSADVVAYVNKPSQKGIVIGTGGRTLKAARKEAERDLKDMFGVRVHLEIWVKVEPNWMKNNRLLAEMGYAGALI
ncbi:MAG: GTPase Era [Kiritimatiellae bacterium]|nr:GTPase Era [Kiritimatiellia bacterium]